MEGHKPIEIYLDDFVDDFDSRHDNWLSLVPKPRCC